MDLEDLKIFKRKSKKLLLYLILEHDYDFATNGFLTMALYSSPINFAKLSRYRIRYRGFILFLELSLKYEVNGFLLAIFYIAGFGREKLKSWMVSWQTRWVHNHEAFIHSHNFYSLLPK